MRSLPKPIRVGSRLYKVRELVESRARKRNQSGLCSFARQIIYVRTFDQSPSQIANTVFHEVLHAAWFEARLPKKPDEERAVTALADELTRIVRDNPGLVDWIAEKARS